MNEMVTQMGAELVTLVLRIIMAVVGVLLANACRKHLNTDAKKAIARNAVLFVEQTCRDLHGKAKLSQALQIASAQLREKHINVSVDEMKVLIEAAVAEFNKAFEKRNVVSAPEWPAGTEDLRDFVNEQADLPAGEGQ